MNYLIKSSLVAFLVAITSISIPTKAQTIKIETIEKKLQSSLNNPTTNQLEKIFSKESLVKLEKERDRFSKNYSNTNWIIKNIQKNIGSKKIYEVLITGERKLGDQSFFLETNQILSIEIIKNKIIDYQVLNESSILKTLNSPLEVKVSIPDQVLTGERYDIDIIIEQPLSNNFLTGGLISTNKDEIKTGNSPHINLFQLNSGGIFKSIQAPFNPGKQTLAALLVHPEGIICITKVVRIISNLEEVS